MRFSFIHMSFLAVFLTFAGSGAAQTLGEAGTNGDSNMGVDAGDDATPIACDGALCDTTNGSSCTLVSTAPRDGSLASMVAMGVLLVAGLARRARPKELWSRDGTS